ncbi:hypothetical protein, partial [Salinisphaera sp. G21_0]|uniref:hypothetical protein n=1 Tax=Salinisphaera sp. G21_0 TaxID=2821094 RepID=UPI001ADB3010
TILLGWLEITEAGMINNHYEKCLHNSRGINALLFQLFRESTLTGNMPVQLKNTRQRLKDR